MELVLGAVPYLPWMAKGRYFKYPGNGYFKVELKNSRPPPVTENST